MHAAYAHGPAHDATRWHGPPVRVSRPAPPPPPSPPEPEQRSVYGAGKRTNLPLIVAVIALHALLLAALVTLDVIQVSPPKRKPLVVELLSLPKPTPPPPPAAAEPVPAKDTPREAPQIVTPEPIVKTAAPPTIPVVAAPPPPAPRAVAVAATPAPAAPGPASLVDLSSKLISGNPPRYPVESRRRKEQGTVVLLVLVGTNGAVAEVNVSQSSGSSRLDKAALDAVRRWRWSPTVQSGQPVMVRGYVDIPFVLA